MAVTYVLIKDPLYGDHIVPMDPPDAVLLKRESQRPGFEYGSVEIVETRISYGNNPVLVPIQQAVANAAYWELRRNPSSESAAVEAAKYLGAQPAPFPASVYQRAVATTLTASGLQGLFGGKT